LDGRDIYHTWREQEMLNAVVVQCPNERDYVKNLGIDGGIALNDSYSNRV
jgi:hypothetical protein